MPSPGLSFRAGRSTVTFDPAGTVTAVVPDARPGESYLDRAGPVRVRTRGHDLEWSVPELEIDVDELEVTHRHPRLSATVRHSFGAGWGVRLALANLTADRLTLDEVTLGWAATPGWPAWALAAGAVGTYLVSHPDGQGPVLGGTLGLGALESVGPTGLGTGSLVLEPGGRYVVAWQWDLFADARAYAARPGGQRAERQVPRSLHLSVGETTLIAAGDDEALLLPEGVVADPVRDQVELIASGAGRYPVELRTARGVTHYDLCWAEPVEQVLAELAADVLTGRRTPAGIVRLTGVEAALVVQLALRTGLDDADDAAEALDLFTARLPAAAELDPRTAGYLCGEFDRSGDEDALAVATAIVMDHSRPVPGLGLAASQLGLARMLAGMPVEGLARHLAAIADTLPPPGAGSVSEQAAALEVAVLTPRSGPSTDVTQRLLAVGAWLGAGLKGHPVRGLEVAEQAHLAAVLAALDEETSVSLRRRWVGTAHELGRWTESAVVSRLTDTPNRAADPGPAHAWLAVAARTR